MIDASGPGGFSRASSPCPLGWIAHRLARRQFFSHFAGVRMMQEVVPGLPDGPYPDDWTAVHHLIDEGWMYSLR